MAILYGTTADGDSLPVEVNEFGQLVAQGLPGQPGPPGPPGVGELPPDPFEGAILGWKDNKLSWLGGSVPLPPGTYGPIAAYAEGVLTLQEAVDLPYLTSIFLSDELGTRYSYQLSSSAITAIDGPNVFASYATSGSGRGGNNDTTGIFNNVFDGNLQTRVEFYSNEGRFTQIIVLDKTYTGEVVLNTSYYGLDYGEATITIGNATQIPLSKNTSTPVPQSWGVQTFNQIVITNNLFTGGGAGININTVQVDGEYLLNGVTNLTLADATNLSSFRVGMEVQENVSITQIDEAVPSITTAGGEWSLGDFVTTPTLSGDGTVESTSGTRIDLRADNEEWLVGKYVTAPEQALAARYVYSDEIRRKRQ
jgi:hypothetical protein